MFLLTVGFVSVVFCAQVGAVVNQHTPGSISGNTRTPLLNKSPSASDSKEATPKGKALPQQDATLTQTSSMPAQKPPNSYRLTRHPLWHQHVPPPAEIEISELTAQFPEKAECFQPLGKKVRSA